MTRHTVALIFNLMKVLIYVFFAKPKFAKMAYGSLISYDLIVYSKV